MAEKFGAAKQKYENEFLPFLLWLTFIMQFRMGESCLVSDHLPPTSPSQKKPLGENEGEGGGCCVCRTKKKKEVSWSAAEKKGGKVFLTWRFPFFSSSFSSHHPQVREPEPEIKAKWGGRGERKKVAPAKSVGRREGRAGPRESDGGGGFRDLELFCNCILYPNLIGYTEKDWPITTQLATLQCAQCLIA